MNLALWEAFKVPFKKQVSFKLLLILFSSFLSGCYTIQMPSAPSVQGLQTYPGALTIEVQEVINNRAGKSAGQIGLGGLKVPMNLGPVIRNHLMAALNKELRLNVVPSSRAADYFFKVSVGDYSASSIDAGLFDTKISFKLNVVVRDSSSNVVYRKDFMQEGQQRMDVSVIEKQAGKLTEQMVLRTIHELVSDPALKRLF